MKQSEEEAGEDDTNGLWNGQPFKPLPAVDVPDLPAGCARAMSLQVCMHGLDCLCSESPILAVLHMLLTCFTVFTALCFAHACTKEENINLHKLVAICKHPSCSCVTLDWGPNGGLLVHNKVVSIVHKTLYRGGNVGHMAPAWATPPTRASGSQRSPPPLHHRRCVPCQRPQGEGGGGAWVAPPGRTPNLLLAPSSQEGVAGCQRRSSMRLTKSHSMRMSRPRYVKHQWHVDKARLVSACSGRCMQLTYVFNTAVPTSYNTLLAVS